jgi:hypothetical protein
MRNSILQENDLNAQRHTVPAEAKLPKRLREQPPPRRGGVGLDDRVRVHLQVALRNKKCTGLGQIVGQIQASGRDYQSKQVVQFGPTL